MAKNFGKLLKDDRERLMGLHPRTWAGMLKSDSLFVNSEEQLFEAVLEYANEMKEDEDQEGGESKRQAVLALLLPLVRFQTMSGKYLFENVESRKDLQDIPNFKDMYVFACSMPLLSIE